MMIILSNKHDETKSRKGLRANAFAPGTTLLGKRNFRKSQHDGTGRVAMKNLPKKKVDLGYRIGILPSPKCPFFLPSANCPGSMPVPTEIGLLSTRVDSYRHPIDTQTTPFRHPKILVLPPSATAQNRQRSSAYRQG